jgi:hypothetical protein
MVYSLRIVEQADSLTEDHKHNIINITYLCFYQYFLASWWALPSA